MTAEQDRIAMVNRLQARGIADPRVLAAMRAVPRERFVPPDQAPSAYHDAPLDIGLGQTISTPWIVGFSIAALQTGADGHVLEVGTGSGYGAAVLAYCCRSVVTVERHPQLAERARLALAATGFDNVEVRIGDGVRGAADRAPFDGIVVTAMASGGLPRPLVEQLVPGGTLVCPVGRRRHGSLVRYRARRSEKLATVAFVPLVTSPP